PPEEGTGDGRIDRTPAKPSSWPRNIGKNPAPSGRRLEQPVRVGSNPPSLRFISSGRRAGCFGNQVLGIHRSAGGPSGAVPKTRISTDPDLLRLRGCAAVARGSERKTEPHPPGQPGSSRPHR